MRRGADLRNAAAVFPPTTRCRQRQPENFSKIFNLARSWELRMKAILVMFDSLNRRMLPPTGAVGARPQLPAPLTAGRHLREQLRRQHAACRRGGTAHRTLQLAPKLGPARAVRRPRCRILKNAGVYTHLVSDHYHYWEEGGATTTRATGGRARSGRRSRKADLGECRSPRWCNGAWDRQDYQPSRHAARGRTSAEDLRPAWSSCANHRTTTGSYLETFD